MTDLVVLFYVLCVLMAVGAIAATWIGFKFGNWK